MADINNNLDTVDSFVEACWMISGVFFILSLGGLSNQLSAKRGNLYGIYGMALAIFVTLFSGDMDGQGILKFFIAFLAGGIIGIILAVRVDMINMPQMVAALHSFVGIAATLVGFSSYIATDGAGNNEGVAHNIEIYAGIFIGVITFIGSVVAYLKLQGTIGGEPLIILGWGRHVINAVLLLAVIAIGVLFVIHPLAPGGLIYLFINTGLALLIGAHLIMAIGGADMPVVVSMLNSYSGWATSFCGFMLNQVLLIVAGAFIGSSGAILSYIMCKSMNRSFVGVIMGGFGISAGTKKDPEGAETTLDEVIQDLEEAKTIVIVPGYGMAQSKAQGPIAALTEALRKKRKDVTFCLHPIAGRLPGHMNVLLAQANVPMDLMRESEEVNRNFEKVDLVLVIGANDTVNPQALEDPSCAIGGMAVCEVWRAKKVIVNKRGKAGKGYAAVPNTLFAKPNCRMFYGDAAVQSSKLAAYFSESKSDVDAGSIIAKKKVIAVKTLTSQELEALRQKAKRTISVPRETYPDEKRIAIVPAIAQKLLELGFKVIVERGAGEAAGFPDSSYETVGCEFIDKTYELWSTADLLVKIRPPSLEEAEWLNKDAELLVAYTNPPANSKEELAKLAQELAEKLYYGRPKLSVISLEKHPRTLSRVQKCDTITTTANVIGYRAVLEAFNEFPKFANPLITAGGKVEPAKVLILGCGIVGLAAIGLAKKLGAIVRANDVRKAGREEAESLGAEPVAVPGDWEGSGPGGYAKAMGADYNEAQKKWIIEQAKDVDIIITTALIPGTRAPILIPDEAVAVMKPNSVIVDLAAELGGNCSKTKPGQRHVTENGVIILGYTNMVSRMAQQASELFSMNIYNYFEEFCKKSKDNNNDAKDFQIDPTDEFINASLSVHQGAIYHKKEIKKEGGSHIAINIESGAKKDGENEAAKFEGESGLGANILNSLWVAIPLILGALFLGLITLGNDNLLFYIFIFILAIFIGYMVIWNVSPALHTPLMSVTNAISGIIIIGSMLEISSQPFFTAASILAFIGSFFASINIFGGFVVSQRMLNYFYSDSKGGNSQAKGHRH